MRRSGRTFRMMLKLIIKASEGRDTMMIVHKADYAVWLAKKMRDMLSVYGVPTSISKNRCVLTLVDNGASITFRSAGLRGMSDLHRAQVRGLPDAVFQDSSVWEG